MTRIIQTYILQSLKYIKYMEIHDMKHQNKWNGRIKQKHTKKLLWLAETENIDANQPGQLEMLFSCLLSSNKNY